jgi:mono/diheme cytochrome c family protein
MLFRERSFAWLPAAAAATMTLLLSFSMAACSSYQEKDVKDLSRSQGGGTISYSTVREKVFVPNCVACHGTSGGVNLESYKSVKLHLKKIEKVVFVTQTMPKGRNLGSAESELLRTWINAGAPETVTGETPSTGEPLQPTFASIKKKIFEPKCLACHTPGGAAAGVSLDSDKDLLGSPRDLVIPGNPSESGLYIAITRTDSKRMPPPSSGASALSTEEVIAIKQWIEVGTNGAPPALDGSKLSYEFVRKKVFLPSCVTCHGSSGGVNLESYENVKKNLSAIGQAALVKEIMPKNGTLSAKQRDVLATWILAGGPRVPGDVSQPVTPPSGSPNEVSYRAVKDRIFTPRCITCHGNSGGVNLETYASAKEHAGQIAIMALVTKAMPPSGPLPKEEADLLTAWLKAGAPEGVVAPGNPIDNEPLKPTFVSIKKKIFEPRCVTCHRVGGPASGVSLSKLKDLLDSPRELVLPGNPDESGLLIAVSRQDSRRMPPPSAGAALSVGEIATLREWIQIGAPENGNATPVPAPSPTASAVPSPLPSLAPTP